MVEPRVSRSCAGAYGAERTTGSGIEQGDLIQRSRFATRDP
jgi:hypothetical protein